MAYTLYYAFNGKRFPSLEEAEKFEQEFAEDVANDGMVCWDYTGCYVPYLEAKETLFEEVKTIYFHTEEAIDNFIDYCHYNGLIDDGLEYSNPGTYRYNPEIERWVKLFE